MDKTKFGNWVKETRDLKKMKNSDIAKISGISESQISRIIRGESEPTQDTIIAIARGLRVPREEAFRAAFMFLLDTGVRASELCAVNLVDVNLVTGAVMIAHGKGDKSRYVFMGKHSRRAVRAYLKQRTDSDTAMWVTDDGNRLTYWGLNQILRRRAKQAGIKKPGLHDFRRAFAINFLRNSPKDIYSLQHLMGHADLQVLRRYLRQTDADIMDAHRRASPVDNWRL